MENSTERNSRTIIFRNYEMYKAYKWAKSEQKRMGLTAEIIRIKCSEDNPELAGYNKSNKGFVAALFISEDENETPLLTCYWLEDGGIKCNLVVNYKELRMEAPRYTERLLDNGVQICKHFDGFHGGISKYIPDKEFQYC